MASADRQVQAGAVDTVRRAVQDALKAGVSTHELTVVLAEESGWKLAPAIIAMELRACGRSTSNKGIQIGQITATELRYVDCRWVVASTFYSPQIGGYWVEGIERFIRRLSQPIVVGKRPIRDYEIIKRAFATQGVGAVPQLWACPSHRLASNGEFPAVFSEIPSFLNVLAVTPTKIRQLATLMEL